MECFRSPREDVEGNKFYLSQSLALHEFFFAFDAVNVTPGAQHCSTIIVNTIVSDFRTLKLNGRKQSLTYLLLVWIVAGSGKRVDRVRIFVQYFCIRKRWRRIWIFLTFFFAQSRNYTCMTDSVSIQLKCILSLRLSVYNTTRVHTLTGTIHTVSDTFLVQKLPKFLFVEFKANRSRYKSAVSNVCEMRATSTWHVVRPPTVEITKTENFPRTASRVWIKQYWCEKKRRIHDDQSDWQALCEPKQGNVAYTPTLAE